MTSHGKTVWTDPLIPNLDQSATADLISRLCDFDFILSSVGQITQTVTSPFLAPKLDLTPWTGLQFKDTLTKESVPKFEARLAEFQRGQKEVRPVELNHRATDQQAELPVRYTYHSGAADGSTLLLGSDGRLSCRITGTPLRASCPAASLPARPPPITCTGFWVVFAMNRT